jgi:hypothetical protein
MEYEDDDDDVYNIEACADENIKSSHSKRKICEDDMLLGYRAVHSR